jgi:hypothetical protein
MGLLINRVSTRSLTEGNAAPRNRVSVRTRRQTATRTLLRITHATEDAHRAGALRLRGGVCLSDERGNSPFRHDALAGAYAWKRIHTNGFECSPLCSAFHQYSMKRVPSASWHVQTMLLRFVESSPATPHSEPAHQRLCFLAVMGS